MAWLWLCSLRLVVDAVPPSSVETLEVCEEGWRERQARTPGGRWASGATSGGGGNFKHRLKFATVVGLSEVRIRCLFLVLRTSPPPTLHVSLEIVLSVGPGGPPSCVGAVLKRLQAVRPARELRGRQELRRAAG